MSHSVSPRVTVLPGAAAATRRACSVSAISRRIIALLAGAPSGSSTRSQARRCASPPRNASNTWSSCSPIEDSGCVNDATRRSLSSAAASRVSARTSPARLPKWCRISGCEMPASAAMSCSRSPCGPVRATSAWAVSRISRLASSGVRRTRLAGSVIVRGLPCRLAQNSMLTKLSVDNILRIEASMRRCAMPQSASTRLHPVAALRAMRNLIRDREDTKQVFLLIEALRGKTTLRQLARFRQSETGRAMLAERRSLLARLSDRASLAALPPGSLGRAYYEFMATEDLSAEGLVEVSKIQRPLSGDDLTWFRERNREMHDLLHTVTGYGRDPLGEGCVVAFSYAQTGLKGFALIATVTAFRIARRLPGQHVPRAVFEAYRQGRRADWLIGADWENLLSQPVDVVRAQLGVSPPTYYPRILPDLRRIIAAASAQSAHPAAL